MTNARIRSLITTAIDALTPANNPEEVRALTDLEEAFELCGDAGLSVEVSAVQFDGTSVSTCNDQPQHAQGFGVYIRDPLALHVLDFNPTAPELMTGDKFVTLREAHGFAFRYAGALASHLGCEVVTTLAEPATYWPSRFAIQPERDWNAGDKAKAGTHFGPCEDSEATQWGVYELPVAKDGRPIHGTSELVEDYPTREAAQAAIDALERGQPLPDPVWQKAKVADGWEECDEATRNILFAQGFAPEQTGGGCVAAVLYRPNGAKVMATATDGGSMPDATDWLIGAYDCEGEDVLTFDGAAGRMKMAQAVAACIAVADLCQQVDYPAADRFGTIDQFAILFDPGDSDGAVLCDLTFDTVADAQRHADALVAGALGSAARVVHVSGTLPADAVAA